MTPGVYELAAGARVCDAVEAAGGFTKKASKDYWNLAEPLTDGQMISFPTKEEAAEREKYDTSDADTDKRLFSIVCAIHIHAILFQTESDSLHN